MLILPLICFTFRTNVAKQMPHKTLMLSIERFIHLLLCYPPLSPLLFIWRFVFSQLSAPALTLGGCFNLPFFFSSFSFQVNHYTLKNKTVQKSCSSSSSFQFCFHAHQMNKVHNILILFGWQFIHLKE